MPQEILLEKGKKPEIKEDKVVVKQGSHLYSHRNGVDSITYNLNKDIEIRFEKDDSNFYRGVHTPENLKTMFVSEGGFSEEDALFGLITGMITEFDLQSSEHETQKISRAKIQEYSYLSEIIQKEKKEYKRA
ncbi:hypothetical protein GF361_03525 [Candidatus Woesearchaeota archaeon]|nr:hypothetical protein [Candidatus Woesearchaeota archaeon]